MTQSAIPASASNRLTAAEVSASTVAWFTEPVTT